MDVNCRESDQTKANHWLVFPCALSVRNALFRFIVPVTPKALIDRKYGMPALSVGDISQRAASAVRSATSAARLPQCTKS
jgi:hypothetical protein